MLRIEKDKIKYFKNEDDKKYRVISNHKGYFLRFLNENIELAEDLTFGDFFKFLIKEKDDINRMFSGSLCGIDFDEFIKDFNKKGDNKKLDEIENFYLELGWISNLHIEEIDIFLDFHGKGKDTEEEMGGGMIVYSIEYTPLNELKKSLLRLNKEFVIWDWRTNKFEELIITQKDFTLYELIHGILWEITFAGTPDMRDNTKWMKRKEGKVTKFVSEEKIIKTLRKNKSNTK